MTTKYTNSVHNPSNPLYGPEIYDTQASPVMYKGFAIFERVKGSVFDVVQDNVCLTQMAGMTGARRAIDALADNRPKAGDVAAIGTGDLLIAMARRTSGA